MTAPVDDRGNCYGTGTPGLEFRVEDNGLRSGLCRECGRWVGVVGVSSDRLTHHAPTSTRAPNPHRERNARLAARMNVAEWIGTERREYADIKYADTEARHKLILETQNFGLGGEWMVFAGGYLKRAELQGLDTARGRQALGKAIVTLTHALETAVQYHGPMPKPGVSSTDDLQEWRH
jgi:hypothetical protein